GAREHLQGVRGEGYRRTGRTAYVNTCRAAVHGRFRNGGEASGGGGGVTGLTAHAAGGEVIHLYRLYRELYRAGEFAGVGVQVVGADRKGDRVRRQGLVEAHPGAGGMELAQKLGFELVARVHGDSAEVRSARARAGPLVHNHVLRDDGPGVPAVQENVVDGGAAVYGDRQRIDVEVAGVLVHHGRPADNTAFLAGNHLLGRDDNVGVLEIGRGDLPLDGPDGVHVEVAEPRFQDALELAVRVDIDHVVHQVEIQSQPGMLPCGHHQGRFGNDFDPVAGVRNTNGCNRPVFHGRLVVVLETHGHGGRGRGCILRRGQVEPDLSVRVSRQCAPTEERLVAGGGVSVQPAVGELGQVNCDRVCGNVHRLPAVAVGVGVGAWMELDLVYGNVNVCVFQARRIGHVHVHGAVQRGLAIP